MANDNDVIDRRGKQSEHLEAATKLLKEVLPLLEDQGYLPEVRKIRAVLDQGRCVLDGYSECAAKIPEACICAKMPAKMFRERFERKYGELQRAEKS